MKTVFIALGIGILTLTLVGCGASSRGSVLDVGDYQFVYQGTATLEKSLISSLDGLDFLAIYTESGAKASEYQDSLLITEKYNQGKGVVVFSQEAIATLKTQGLTLENEKNERFVIACAGEQKAVNLVSYAISSGFIATVPKLYMTQMVLEKDQTNLVIFSHSTEYANEQQQMIASFKTIHCKT
jgi:hypothetical protein